MASIEIELLYPKDSGLSVIYSSIKFTQKKNEEIEVIKLI